jgi:hypothetical protein
VATATTRTASETSPVVRSWLLPLGVVVTVGVLLLGLAAPSFPTSGGHAWVLARRAMDFEALQSLPSWWSAVLPVLGALSAVEAAGQLRSTVARGGWWLLALLLTWLSVDHLVAVHEAVARLEVPALGPLARHPVELALVLGGLLAGVALVTSSPRPVVVLLLAAGLVYAASVVVDVLGSPVDMSLHHTAMLEVGLEWAGLLLALAASLRAPAYQHRSVRRSRHLAA